MKIKTLDKFKVTEGVRVPYFGGLLYRKVSKWENKAIRKFSIDDFHLNDKARNEKIIVSLTSYSKRINSVGYAIKSLFRQTVLPDRIILWLAEEERENLVLPDLLKDLCDKGLEIRFCENLRSHKKYYFALKEQKENELVITYDDDIIYPEDSIERLYKKHLAFPDCIVCNRAEEVEIKDGKLAPYERWHVHSSVGVKKPSARLFPSTGGGTLYPFKCLDKEVFNVDAIREYAFSVDDLWIGFMAAKSGVKFIKTRKNYKPFSTIQESQVVGLQQENCFSGGNDKAIAVLSEKYPEALLNILKND